MKTYCKTFQHQYKPAVRKGPMYVLGMYAGHDWLGTGDLACSKCGKRRLPFLTVAGSVAAGLFWSAIGLAAAGLFISFVVMMLRVAVESWP